MEKENDMNYRLEVCTDSVRSAVEAQKGGADRIELCSNLIIGGTTPDKSLFRLVHEYTDIPVRVIIRPRFGDFCYDSYELEMMKEDVQMFREMGASGVVIGILTPQGELDMEKMSMLTEAAGDMKKTLHRAFDMSRDAFTACENAIALGMDTILTSGQKNSALEGRELLGQLQKQYGEKIEILAGAGVDADVIRTLAKENGITSFHMSGKMTVDSKMVFRRAEVAMGLKGFSEYEIWQTDAEKIKEARAVLVELG